tara:strand:+ start:299 stop:739 length:441 start_codon:yes stop_codon:yes gene_type:complete
MKIKYLIILFNIIFAQDSLFWFDMSTVKDPIPLAPKVLDGIYGTSQIKVLDSLKNIRATTRDGFRIQVFETSSSEKANSVFRKYKKKMVDSLYVIFDAPLYKIQYGNFSKKYEAENVKKKLRQKGFKNIWIVRSRIEQKYLYKPLE